MILANVQELRDTFMQADDGKPRYTELVFPADGQGNFVIDIDPSVRSIAEAKNETGVRKDMRTLITAELRSLMIDARSWLARLPPPEEPIQGAGSPPAASAADSVGLVETGDGPGHASSPPAAGDAPSPPVLVPTPKASASPTGPSGDSLMMQTWMKSVGTDPARRLAFKSNAEAWAFVFSSDSPKQRKVFRRYRSQNTMVNGMYPEWPAGMSSAEYKVYAYKWMKAAGIRGTNTGPKVQVDAFDGFSDYSRAQFEHVAIVIPEQYLFKGMPLTGQWYVMFNGDQCSERDLDQVSRAICKYVRVKGSNPSKYEGRLTMLADGGFIHIDHLVDLLVKHDRAIRKDNRLSKLTIDGMKALVLTVIANGVYENDWGVRNHRYGMVEYGSLLDEDWQHPQPEEP